jgi:RNA polymerase sigma-70 factor (ECF subfamily)
MAGPELVPDLAALAARPDDPRARAHLVRGVHQVVRRYCRALLGRSGRDFGPADELAAQVAASLLRERGDDLRGPVPVEAVVYEAMAPAVARVLGERTPRPSRRAAGPPTPERLHEQLVRLPPRPREVLVLRAFVGMTSEQAGRALGMPPEVVRREQARALAALGPR